MPAFFFRRTASFTLAATAVWLGLAAVPIDRGGGRASWRRLGGLPPALAQTTSRIAWTNPYVSALEAQTNLVLRAQPLDNVLTRIELAQWLTEFFGYVPDPQQRLPIVDMEIDSPDYWTAQAVLQAGIMRSFEGDRFQPDGDLTKLEALAIYARALQLTALPEADVDRWLALYRDRETLPEIGRSFIAVTARAGVLVNHPDPALIEPNLILTRGEGVVMLHQALAFRRQIAPLAPPVAQLAPEAVPRPELAGNIQVMPSSGRVPPGSSLVVEARGTPGGIGTVLLAGSIEIAMQEIQPGLYRATYIPTEADFIANPSIGVQLELNGEFTRLQRQFPQLALGNALDPTGPPPIASPPSLPAPIPPAPRPAPPNVASLPNLTAIRFKPIRDLRQGDIFTVMIRGDSGGVARFGIDGLVADQPLREIRPGIYEGTYVVATNHFSTSPNLQVILLKNGQGVRHREVLPFEINGAAIAAAPLPIPAEPPRRPRRDRENARPRNRPQEPTVPPIGSQPAPTPAPVPAPIPAPAPAPTPASTASGLGQNPLIFTVSSNAGDRPLRPNDVLQVTMRGEQRGRAVFRILNVLPDVAMEEIAPGMYRGQIRIGRNTPAIRNGIVQVELERGGLRTTRSLPAAIDIDPSAP